MLNGIIRICIICGIYIPFLLCRMTHAILSYILTWTWCSLYSQRSATREYNREIVEETERKRGISSRRNEWELKQTREKAAFNLKTLHSIVNTFQYHNFHIVIKFNIMDERFSSKYVDSMRSILARRTFNVIIITLETCYVEVILISKVILLLL